MAAVNDLLNRAMRLLAVRDHGETELRRKLAAQPFIGAAHTATPLQSPLPEEIEQVIAYCYRHDYLNDARFARHYIASRSRKGYGVQRIRSELKRKGVDNALIAEALASADVDWCLLAQELAERKFGLPLPTEWKEKAKVQRYLLYWGFFHEEIQAIYANFAD